MQNIDSYALMAHEFPARFDSHYSLDVFVIALSVSMISILVPRVESDETNSWHSKSYQRSIVLSINVISRPYLNDVMLVKT